MEDAIFKEPVVVVGQFDRVLEWLPDVDQSRPFMTSNLLNGRQERAIGVE